MKKKIVLIMMLLANIFTCYTAEVAVAPINNVSTVSAEKYLYNNTNYPFIVYKASSMATYYLDRSSIVVKSNEVNGHIYRDWACMIVGVAPSGATFHYVYEFRDDGGEMIYRCGRDDLSHAGWETLNDYLSRYDEDQPEAATCRVSWRYAFGDSLT